MNSESWGGWAGCPPGARRRLEGILIWASEGYLETCCRGPLPAVSSAQEMNSFPGAPVTSPFLPTGIRAPIPSLFLPRPSTLQVALSWWHTLAFCHPATSGPKKHPELSLQQQQALQPLPERPVELPLSRSQGQVRPPAPVPWSFLRPGKALRPQTSNMSVLSGKAPEAPSAGPVRR